MNTSENFNITLEDIRKDAEMLISRAKTRENNPIGPFPVDIFPPSIQDVIKSTNECLNFPIDFIGSSMLYAVSVAIGNTHKVEVLREFQESAVIYMAIVARAGTNKSAPLSFALKPIIDQDKRSFRQYELKREEYEKISKLSKKQRESKSIEEPSRPVWEKFLLSDFTPEALAQVHKYNRRGVGVYVDELAGWFKNFNRYSKGSEMEFWLSSWSGKPINIDRKTGEPVFISLPSISVIGTIQNSLLDELARESRSQNGFIDRILFVIPDNIQKPYWSEIQLPSHHVSTWNNAISRILNVPLDLDDTKNPIPKVLQFAPDAKRLLIEWQRKNADQCNNPENEHLSGIYSKLEMYVARLSLILEMVSWACGESSKDYISFESLSGALQLIEYFKKSAVKVHSFISCSSPVDRLPTAKRNLYELLPENFTTETGVAIAESVGIAERTFKRFLTEKNFFTCVKRGQYEKRI